MCLNNAGNFLAKPQFSQAFNPGLVEPLHGLTVWADNHVATL